MSCDVDASSPSTGTAAAGSPVGASAKLTLFGLLCGLLCLGWQSLVLSGARWLESLLATCGVLTVVFPALWGAFFRNFGCGGWGGFLDADRGVNRRTGSRGQFSARPRALSVLLLFVLFQGCEAGRIDASLTAGLDRLIAVAGLRCRGSMAIAFGRMVCCCLLLGFATFRVFVGWLWGGSRHHGWRFRRRTRALPRLLRSGTASGTRQGRHVRRLWAGPHPWALLLRIAFAMRGGDAIFVVSLLAVWHVVHGWRGGGGSDGPDRGVAL